MEEQINLIELQSFICEAICNDVPYLIVLDQFDREVMLTLPTSQKAGTNYQMLTYANICAAQAVNNLLLIEELDDQELDCYNKGEAI